MYNNHCHCVTTQLQLRCYYYYYYPSHIHCTIKTLHSLKKHVSETISSVSIVKWRFDVTFARPGTLVLPSLKIKCKRTRFISTHLPYGEMFCPYLQREVSETACYLHNPHKTGTAFQKPPQNTSLSMLQLHQLPNYVMVTFLLQCDVYMRWNSR